MKKRDKGLARQIALQAGLRMGILSLALFLTFGLVHLVQGVRQLLLDPLDTAAARLERKLSDGELLLAAPPAEGLPTELRFLQTLEQNGVDLVILLEDGAYMLEKIIGAVLFVVRIQAGGTGKRLISSQCTVTHGADSNRYWLAGKDGLVSVDHESFYLNIRLFCLVALILRVLFFPGRALKFFCKINDISGTFRSRGPDSEDKSGGKEEKKESTKNKAGLSEPPAPLSFLFCIFNSTHTILSSVCLPV